ncbi:MAG: ATP:cob(I)alamin adenosyltransferase [Candidatus Nanoarchaeia archaeon]
MNKSQIYTKTGDEGHTSKYDGTRVPKDDPLIILVAKVDALQGSLDLAFNQVQDKDLLPLLDHIQTKLWQTAGELSLGEPGKKIKDEITSKDLEELEHYIDKYDQKKTYFLRFRTESSARLNDARIKCRELEVHLTPFLREKKIRSEVYKYINRLSDLLYVLACHEQKDTNENSSEHSSE